MHRLVFALTAVAPILILSACNSQPTVKAENASVEEVMEKAKDAGAIKIEPGEWASKAEVLELDMPGMKDPGIANMMKQQMQARAATVNSYCITPEEAEKPGSDMFAGTKKGECKYDSFKMGGGKLDAVMSCASPGGEMHATMTGTYSATSYDMTMAMDMSNAQMPGGGMKMKVHTTGERTGECKPGDQ